jgi:hypothetical protein
MKSEVELNECLAQLEASVGAIRVFVKPDRVEFVRPSQNNIDLMVAWPLLFRTINLAEAAIQSARSRNGEAVALVARSLAELSYLIGFVGQDFERVGDYVVGSFADTQRKRKKIAEKASDPIIRKAAGQSVQKFGILPKSLYLEWGEKIEERARVAHMEQDYLVRYHLLCNEAHHSESALYYYMKECRDGIEIWPRVDDRQVALWLKLAIYYWAKSVRPLMRHLRLANARRIKQAFEPIKLWLSALE